MGTKWFHTKSRQYGGKEKQCRRFNKKNIQHNHLEYKQINKNQTNTQKVNKYTKGKQMAHKLTLCDSLDHKISYIQYHTTYFILSNNKKPVINMISNSTILGMIFWQFLKCKKVWTNACYEYEDKLDQKKTKKIHFLILHGLSGLYKDQANNVYESHWKHKI